jgi:hypothetical protein
MTTVTGLFKDKDKAERAFQAVIKLGYDKSDVNVIVDDEVRQRYFAAHNPTKDPDTTDLAEATADTSDSESHSLGGPVGGTVSTLTPIVTAVGVLLIPGIGIVAGPVAAALAAAAATGAALGLMGLLADWGIPESRVEQYEAGIRAGGILLGVRAKSDADALRIQQCWQESGGEHIHS